jgi:hypothetical protein
VLGARLPLRALASIAARSLGRPRHAAQVRRP